MVTRFSVPPSDETIQDIMVKFIYNLGPDLLGSRVQVMFQVERAWWYYEDTLRNQNPHLQHYSNYAEFTKMLSSKAPILSSLLGDIPSTLEEYMVFKQKIPVYGAILLDKNMERVLLVRGLASNHGWGFPKGKINHGEAEVDCACREVLEETGFDIEHLIKPGEYIEAKGQNGKTHKLFIVVGLNPDTAKFAPQLAGEVGAYGWHWLHQLPATREDADKAYIASQGGKAHKFWMVQPFIGRLRNWVSKRRRSLGLPPAAWEAQGVDPTAGLSNTTNNSHHHHHNASQGTPSTQGAHKPGKDKQYQLLQRNKETTVTTGADAATMQGTPSSYNSQVLNMLKTPVGALQGSTAFHTPVSNTYSFLPSTLSFDGLELMFPGRTAAALTSTLKPSPTKGRNDDAAQAVYSTPNLVMSSEFRFDTRAILECFAA